MVEQALVERLLPCPFCRARFRIVESWARAFDPPRLYREYHHDGDFQGEFWCPLGKRSWTFAPEAEKAENAWIAAWNTRTPIGDEVTEAMSRFHRTVQEARATIDDCFHLGSTETLEAVRKLLDCALTEEATAIAQEQS